VKIGIHNIRLLAQQNRQSMCFQFQMSMVQTWKGPSFLICYPQRLDLCGKACAQMTWSRIKKRIQTPASGNLEMNFYSIQNKKTYAAHVGGKIEQFLFVICNKKHFYVQKIAAGKGFNNKKLLTIGIIKLHSNVANHRLQIYGCCLDCLTTTQSWDSPSSTISVLSSSRVFNCKISACQILR
jgi:hypothetical protein